MSACLRRLLLVLGILLSTTSIAVAGGVQGEKQDPPAGNGASEDSDLDPVLARKLRTPRSTLLNFLRTANANNKSEAVLYLDMSSYDAETAKSKGSDFVVKLKGLIDRIWKVDPAVIPNDPNYSDTIILGNYAKDLTSPDDMLDADQIRLEAGVDGLWRFSKETVAAVDDLWIRWQDRPMVSGLKPNMTTMTFPVWLEGRFPSNLREVHFLMPDYHWICLLILIFVGFALDFAVRLGMNALTKIWFRYVKADVDFKVQKNMWKPIGLLAQSLTWYWGAKLIGFRAEVLGVLLVTLKLLLVVAAVWTAFRLIDVLASFLLKKAEQTSTKFDDLLIPLISKSLKTLAVCIGLIMFVDVFNLEWKAILGGFGIGGAAIAFASKDVIGNFFGSLTVLTDRPFEIGDWVIIEGVEGSVETVGIRSSRIRTFYNSIVVVPNSRLTTAVVDNMGKRQYRRVKTKLGLQYDTTPEQIDAFCEGIRELLRRHPYTRKDYYHVYFNGFSDSSLDILLYCFLECPDWSVELREKHRLFADIMRLANRLGVGFAFPTRTLHMYQEERAASGGPGSLSDPTGAGRRIAAEVAGPALPRDKRPGRVEFTGPSDIPIHGDDDG